MIRQRWVSLWRGRALGALVLTVLGLGACSDDEQGCLWNVDELLARVGAGVTQDRVFCGMVLDGAAPEATDALDCFFGAPADVGAELVVNHCIDCIDYSTYYRTPRSELIRVRWVSRQLTEEPPRRSTVTRCATLAIEGNNFKCSPPEDELYYCAEPESAWEMPEPSPAAPAAPAPGPPIPR